MTSTARPTIDEAAEHFYVYLQKAKAEGDEAAAAVLVDVCDYLMNERINIPRLDAKDTIIKALVRKVHGMISPAPARIVLSAGELGRAEQCHLHLAWDEHNLEVRVTGDT